MLKGQIVFLRGDELHIYSGRDSALENRLSIDDKLKGGYILILPDSYIALISTNIEEEKGDIHDFIDSYLATVMPQNLIGERFGYIDTRPVTVIMYSNNFRRLSTTHKKLINGARLILTPSLIALFLEDGDFVMRTNETVLLRQGKRLIHAVGTIENYPILGGSKELFIDENDFEGLILWMNGLEPDRLKRGIRYDANDRYVNFSGLTAIVTWFFIYAVFSGALFLKLMPFYNDVAGFKKEINRLYRDVGIANTIDPYKALLNKRDALLNQKKSNIETIEIYKTIMDTLKSGATLSSLIIEEDSIYLKGSIHNLERLKEIVSSLSKSLKLKFIVESADIKGGSVNFVLSVRHRG